MLVVLLFLSEIFAHPTILFEMISQELVGRADIGNALNLDLRSMLYEFHTSGRKTPFFTRSSLAQTGHLGATCACANHRADQ